MKGKILLIALILCTFAAFAQKSADSTGSYISKGQWLAGGAISYSAFSNKENPNFKASASGGYLIGKRFAVGLDVSYQHVNASSKGAWPSPFDYKNKYSLLSASIFSRVYFRVKRFAPYGEVNFGWISSTQETNYKFKYNQEFYRAGVGINYFLSRSVVLNTTLSYTYFPHFNPYDFYNFYSSGSDNSSIDLNFGFQLYLSRNKNRALNETNFSFPKKGTWMMGGTLDQKGQVDFLRGYNKPTFTVEVGYFLGHNIALGVRHGYTNTGPVETSSFNLFSRYYPVAKRYAPFAELSIGRSHSNSDYNTYEKIYGSRLNAQAGAGLSYFILKSVAIESKVNFCKDFAFDKGFMSFQMGLQFFL